MVRLSNAVRRTAADGRCPSPAAWRTSTRAAWLLLLFVPAMLLPLSSPAATAAAGVDKERQALEVAANDLERRLTRSGRLYQHPELDSYLQGIAAKLLATDAVPAPGPVRVKAIKDIDANAFALPNGAIFINTALLQRLNDEAELASVLGHELTHFTGAHALLEDRSAQRVSAWSRGLALLFAVTAAIVAKDPQIAQLAASVSSDAAELWVLASVSGYSKDREREADREGMRRLIAAGYDASAGIGAFEALQAATDDEGKTATPYFSSHPRLIERIASFRELVNSAQTDTAGPEPRRGRDAYQAHTRGLALDQAELLIAAKKFDRAEKLLALELQRADSARGRYVEGELARQGVRTADSDSRALAAYERAEALPDPPADAFRQAAFIHRLHGEHDDARRAFVRYLELAPAAADAPIVRAYLTAPPSAADSSSSPGAER